MGVFKRQGNWYIDYYHGTERIREIVGPAKGEALRALSIRKAEIAQGRFNLPRRVNVPTFRARMSEF